MATTIEWTDMTWNPVTGCEKVSQGCKNCYAEGIAERFFAKQYPPNADGTPRQFTDVRCHPERLEEPLHWKKPQRVFVNSMSDLFHENVPFEFIQQVWQVCAKAEKHTFQILTKRPQRMLEFANWMAGADHISVAAWPRNCWIGTSVELNRERHRILPLLQSPAAVHFLSIEPQLEEVDISEFECSDEDGRYLLRPLKGYAEVLDSNSMDIISDSDENPRIDWVICGGESGPGARAFNLDWATSLLQQCRDAGTPFFMKQIGNHPVTYSNVMKMIVSWPGRKDRKGGDMTEWPEHLRVREWPKTMVTA